MCKWIHLVSNQPLQVLTDIFMYSWITSHIFQSLGLQQYSGYRPFELKECVLAIHDLQLSRRGVAFKAVKEKYMQHKVSRFIFKNTCTGWRLQPLVLSPKIATRSYIWEMVLSSFRTWHFFVSASSYLMWMLLFFEQFKGVAALSSPSEIPAIYFEDCKA